MSASRVILDRLPLPERAHVLDALRQETVGGALLLAATLVALAWANSPWRDAYHALGAIEVGPAALHLNLSLQTWATDGLLAVFFFVVGLELKHELVVGTLSKPAQAVLPVVAALCGMTVPALLYVATVLGMGDREALTGWGIPMATDIAFALAVLAVMGSRLPIALRAFLLTLAVVDDLGAIIVIAIFYNDGLSLLPALGFLALLAAYSLLQRARVRTPLVYVPLALLAWALLHNSGIHATIAGVALGLLTRVRKDPDEDVSPADRLEHRVRPWSAAFCVPVFAFFAAGVTVIGLGAEVVTAPVAVAVVVGLVIGKPLGVYGGARLIARYTRAELSPSLRWSDVFAVGLLAGVGFTVSLLIGTLAFAGGTDQLVEAKAGVFIASALATALASVALLRRSRVYRVLYDAEEADEDGDGIPDVYQRNIGD